MVFHNLGSFRQKGKRNRTQLKESNWKGQLTVSIIYSLVAGEQSVSDQRKRQDTTIITAPTKTRLR